MRANQPRPEHYERIYWDFVAATGEKPRIDADTYNLSLIKRIQEGGITKEEMAKLEEAKAKTDALARLETRLLCR